MAPNPIELNPAIIAKELGNVREEDRNVGDKIIKYEKGKGVDELTVYTLGSDSPEVYITSFRGTTNCRIEICRSCRFFNRQTGIIVTRHRDSIELEVVNKLKTTFPAPRGNETITMYLPNDCSSSLWRTWIERLEILWSFHYDYNQELLARDPVNSDESFGFVYCKPISS